MYPTDMRPEKLDGAYDATVSNSAKVRLGFSPSMTLNSCGVCIVTFRPLDMLENICTCSEAGGPVGARLTGRVRDKLQQQRPCSP